jgi:hypothetical protein
MGRGYCEVWRESQHISSFWWGFGIDRISVAPDCTIRPTGPLEKGQTTIQAALAKGLSYLRPPRLGLVPKDSGRFVNTILGKRLIKGNNKKFVQELFVSIRISQAIETSGEPGNKDIIKGRIPKDIDNTDIDYESIKCYKYNREYKLIVIEYF